MNTSTSMRTILAAAAAGALVLGSTAGVATAKPSKPAPAPKIQSVSIHDHSPINVFSVDSAREIQVRATVRYTKGQVPVAAPVSTVTLAAYAKKVQAPAVAPLTAAFTAENLPYYSNTKKDLRLRTVGYKLDQAEVDALKVALVAAAPTKSKVYLCISDVFVTGVTEQSKKVDKRLGDAKGKAVRDCVKVINVDPKTTETTKDDGPANPA